MVCSYMSVERILHFFFGELEDLSVENVGRVADARGE